jgi:hypothetical protein
MENDEEHGKVVLPVIAVAAINESYGMKSDRRILLNPFENTPTMLEVLAIESVANLLKVHRNLGNSEMKLDEFRLGTRRWGIQLWIHVPEVCQVVQLADHLELSASPIVPSEPNGRGVPIEFKEGLCFTAAVNQQSLDGGAILSEAGTRDLVIFCSQSKFEMEYVAQTGQDGDATIAKKEALDIIKAMRKQAASIQAKLAVNPNQRVLMAYDVFTTRSIGARLAKLENPFEPLTNEVIYLTTKECVRTALGAVLSVRSNME